MMKSAPRSIASRSRFRGAKRYYRNLRREAGSFSVDLSDDHWYDLWHTHLDWWGRGNRSTRDRHEHLAALFITLDRVRRQCNETRRRVQTWLSIHPRDSANDALYLHTANPNADSFPYLFPGTDFDAPPPALLRPYLEGTDYLSGALTFGGDPWFVVVPPEQLPEASSGRPRGSGRLAP